MRRAGCRCFVFFFVVARAARTKRVSSLCTAFEKKQSITLPFLSPSLRRHAEGLSLYFRRPAAGCLRTTMRRGVLAAVKAGAGGAAARCSSASMASNLPLRSSTPTSSAFLPRPSFAAAAAAAAAAATRSAPRVIGQAAAAGSKTGTAAAAPVASSSSPSAAAALGLLRRRFFSSSSSNASGPTSTSSSASSSISAASAAAAAAALARSAASRLPPIPPGLGGGGFGAVAAREEASAFRRFVSNVAGPAVFASLGAALCCLAAATYQLDERDRSRARLTKRVIGTILGLEISKESERAPDFAESWPLPLRSLAANARSYWNGFSTAERAVWGVAAVNIVVFSLWHLPVLGQLQAWQRLMTLNFVQRLPPGPPPLPHTLLTANFSHSSFWHMAANTATLVSIGGLAARDMDSE